MYPAETIRRKLDNAANAFPAAAGKKDSRVFRVYCKFNQPVQPDLLQKALDQVILRYPLYQCRLIRGIFWYYFEKTDVKPEVLPDTEAPCGELYNRNRDNLLFQVTYSQDTVNLEMFHALTDGTGAFCFLTDLVRTYLGLMYGIADEETQSPGTRMEQEEDSFSRYYEGGRRQGQVQKSSRAYQMKGRKVPQEQMKLLECTVSVRQMKEISRAGGVSVTVYLTAVLLQALSRTMTKRQKRKPVVLMVPVNLRNYYPSKSMMNFFGWMEIEYRFHREDSFEGILQHVKKRFAQELRKEQVALRMSRYVKIEKIPLLKIIPLGLKNHFLKIGTRLGSRNVTAVFSNLGIVKMPESCETYIRRFGAYASTDKLQMCTCSYRDRFYLGITSKMEDLSVQNAVLEFFREAGIEVSVMTKQDKMFEK